MHGIVSILDQETFKLVMDIWNELENDCGLRGIYDTPIPHFSWQIAEDYKWKEVKRTLKKIALDYEPFIIHATGIAVFTGENPVVYIPIVRTKTLNKLHELIWETISPLSDSSCNLYSPPVWIPHISIAYNDVTQENINCLLEKYAFSKINWTIEIDNLSLFCEPEGNVGSNIFETKLGRTNKYPTSLDKNKS